VLPPLHAHFLQTGAEDGDPPPCLPPVQLELRLTRAPEPDGARARSARLLGESRPHAGEPRKQVLVLSELDLQLAFPCLRVLAEDVQDEPGPVDDMYPVPQRRLELPQLTG
jgi:hypothetical protein